MTDQPYPMDVDEIEKQWKAQSAQGSSQPLPLKPCPFCGEIPLIKVHEHHCIAGMVFRKDKVSFWNNAYCWKLLAEKEAENKQLIEGIRVIQAESKELKRLGLKAADVAKESLEESKVLLDKIQEQADQLKILTEALEGVNSHSSFCYQMNGLVTPKNIEICKCAVKLAKQALDRVRGK